MKRDGKRGEKKIRDEIQGMGKSLELPVKKEPHPLRKGGVSFSTLTLLLQKLWRILKQLLRTCYG